MTIDTTAYQTMVEDTTNRALPEDVMRMTFALGLCGEAGEFAEMVKKHYGHGKKMDYMRAASELGDVLWYVTALAHGMGYCLEDIMSINAAKLEARHPYGFSNAYHEAKP